MGLSVGQRRAQARELCIREFGFDPEAMRKDAERYRWLRKSGAWESEIGMDALSERPERFDAAVDAAMAAGAAGAMPG